jgi:hypothetical protein
VRFCAVVAIVPEEAEDSAIERAKEAGAAGATILPGRGVGGEVRRSFLGLTFEGSQSVLLMVTARHVAMPVLKALRDVVQVNGRSRGVAFSVPIEHLVGIDIKQIEQFEQSLREQES